MLHEVKTNPPISRETPYTPSIIVSGFDRDSVIDAMTIESPVINIHIAPDTILLAEPLVQLTIKFAKEIKAASAAIANMNPPDTKVDPNIQYLKVQPLKLQVLALQIR